jgi:hypothetical protein
MNFSFRLLDIIVPHFSFSTPKNFKIPEPEYQYTIEIGSGIHFDEGKKLIVITLNFRIYTNSKKESLLSELITQFLYEIENFNEVIKKEKSNEFTAPDVLLHTLLGISVSTTRGIFMERNSGNFLNKVFIPIVKPADLINKNNDAK